jgi:hypothetical protein
MIKIALRSNTLLLEYVIVIVDVCMCVGVYYPYNNDVE